MRAKSYIILITATLILCAVLLGMTNSQDGVDDDSPIQLISSSPLNSISPYLMKEYEGKIAIFEADLSAPVRTLDIFVHNLPEYDQQELKNGIPLDSMEEVNQRIEDYDS